MKRRIAAATACMVAPTLVAACLVGCGSAAALFNSIERLVMPPSRLDDSFGGGNRIVISDLGTSWDSAYAVAVQSDGKIVLAGRNATGFALARYTAEGVLDTTFGGADGIVTQSAGASDEGYAVALQLDDNIVVSGISDGEFVVLRFDDADGTLDTGFGASGIVRTNFSPSADYAYSVAIQPVDQKIVAAGTTGDGKFAVARYLTNGTPDEEARSMAIQADGKIVLGGFSHTATRFALARLNANGSPDASFGASGVVTNAYGTSVTGEAVAIQSDGKIVLAGTVYDGFRKAAVIRYLPDGSLDASFGISATGITAIDLSSDDLSVKAIALQADGKILLAGYRGLAGDDFALLRILP